MSKEENEYEIVDVISPKGKVEDEEQSCQFEFEGAYANPQAADISLNQSIGDKNLIKKKEGKRKRKVDFEKLRLERLQEEVKYDRKNRIQYGVLSVLISVLVFISYSFLRVECPFDSDIKCFHFIQNRLFIWIALISFNVSATAYQLDTVIKKKTSYYCSVSCFLFQIYLFLWADNMISLTYYMGVINKVHIYVFIAFILLFFILSGIKTCCVKGNYFALAITLIVPIIIFSYFYLHKMQYSCDYWNQMINMDTTQGDNNNQTCKVTTPSYCWYGIMDKWQDISHYLPECHNTNQDLPSFNQSNPNAWQKEENSTNNRFIGFPSNLNKFSEEEKLDHRLQESVLQRTRTYESLQAAQDDGSEVIFDKQLKQYKMQVIQNQTLSVERREIISKATSKPLLKNVLMIYISAVSRPSMHLKMPLTLNWLEKYNKKARTYEFLKFHSLNKYKNNIFTEKKNHTKINDDLANLFYGRISENMTSLSQTKEIFNSSKIDSIFKEFQDQGFISGYASDICKKSALDFTPKEAQLFESILRDHESYSFNCDPNYSDPEGRRSFFQGPNSIIRRCLYQKSVAEYAFEYSSNFFDAYKDSNKLMHLELNYGNELTGEVINYLDAPLSQFLERMDAMGHLNNTSLLIFNDHGFNLNGIYSKLKLSNVAIENQLPSLFISLPSFLDQKYQQSMSLNQDNLVTTTNIRHFLKHLLNGQDYNESQKSLLSSLQAQENCEQAGIQNCICK